MSKRQAKRQQQAKRKAHKAALMRKPGAKSNYARKRKWLLTNAWDPAEEECPVGRQSRRCFGFEVPDPKPWKSAK